MKSKKIFMNPVIMGLAGTLAGLIIGLVAMGFVARSQYRQKNAALHNVDIMARFIRGTEPCYGALQKMRTDATDSAGTKK